MPHHTGNTAALKIATSSWAFWFISLSSPFPVLPEWLVSRRWVMAHTQAQICTHVSSLLKCSIVASYSSIVAMDKQQMPLLAAFGAAAALAAAWQVHRRIHGRRHNYGELYGMNYASVNFAITHT